MPLTPRNTTPPTQLQHLVQIPLNNLAAWVVVDSGLALSKSVLKEGRIKRSLHHTHDTLRLTIFAKIRSIPHPPQRAQACSSTSSLRPSSSLPPPRRDHAPLWWGRGHRLHPSPRPPLPLFNQGLRACPPPPVHPCPVVVIIPDAEPTTAATGTCITGW